MRKPKYKTGDKVEVCGCLNTIIESVRYSDKYQEYIYWFRDEKSKLCYEAEYAIESA